MEDESRRAEAPRPRLPLTVSIVALEIVVLPGGVPTLYSGRTDSIDPQVIQAASCDINDILAQI
jgi:hypothetical protein